VTEESSNAEQSWFDPGDHSEKFVNDIDSGRTVESTESVDPRPQGRERWVSPGTVSLKGAMREAVQAPPTVFEAVGGHRFFDELVDRFYDAVETDMLLRPMYPADMGPSRERLAGFLAQYWGGPAHYSEQRGHPRLRMRHMPFVIGVEERDAWMKHMTASLRVATFADGTDRPLPSDIRDAMFDHFDNAATHLVNRPAD